MRTGLFAAVAALVAAAALTASCAVVSGLDSLEKVDCLDDCDGGADTATTGDDASNGGDVAVVDAADCPTACSGSTPFCDRGSHTCVECLPSEANACRAGFYCAPLNGGYACQQGCTTAADCTAEADAGTAKDGGSALACCNHLCVDTSSNSANCGGCGTGCSADAGKNGCCNSVCTDTIGNVDDCGGCGKVCSSNNVPSRACGGGACTGGCAALTADCDNDKLTDGCETDVSGNPDKCGGCAKVCSNNHVTSRTCAGGVCNGPCALGFADCNGDRLTDGCEANLGNEPANCGGCGKVCSTNHVPVPSCGGAVCNGACQAGWLDCNADKLADGCECNKQCLGAQCVGYTETTIQQPFTNACALAGATTVLASADDSATAPAALPFAFTYYGAAVTQYWISSNGVVGFGGTASPQWNFTCPMPSTGAQPLNPASSILVYAADLVQSAAGVCVATTGTAPNRQLVITYSGAHTFADTANTSLNMTVILSETSNQIEIRYGTMTAGTLQGDVGLISGGASPVATQVACPGAAPASGTTYRFTP